MIPGAFPIVSGKPPPTVTWTDGASSGSAVSPQTFSSRSIGVADTNREVFVVVYSGVASAVTIGGVSATLVASAASSTLTMWRAAVPTATSASIDVTFTGGGGRLMISVWASYNLLSTTPFATASFFSSSTPATTHTTTIDTAGGGILIAAAATVVNAGDPGPSWTGATLSNNRSLAAGAFDFVLSSSDSQGTPAATGATLRTTWSPAIGSVAMLGATFI